MDFRAVLCALVAAAATVSAVPGPATASTVGGGIRTWTPLSEHPPPGTVSSTSAVSVAKSFDLVTALRGTFAGRVPTMHKANPNVKVLAYTNAMFAQSGQAATFPASYYSYDAKGQKVRTTNYGNYMMNPRSLEGGAAGASWADERFRQCRNAALESGYDGCFLDLLGTAPLKAGYVTSPPIDPATGKQWTETSYLAATSALANQIRKLLSADGHGNLLVYGNGLGSGPRFYAGSKVLLPSLDGGIAESWMRTGPSSLTLWPTETQWKQNVSMLAAGKIYASVKTFAPGTTAQKEQWHKYSLASFLLGADSADGFSFLGSPTSDYAVSSPWWATKLGRPSGAYTRSGAAYVRTFASGKAVVNPTTGVTSVSLGAKYCGLTGFSGNKITLGAHSGDVLRKC